jgi:predicted O-methyltransferase YrrM
MNNYNLAFCPRLQHIKQTGQTIDSQGKTISIRGMSTINNIQIIREIMIELRPQKTLEIGLVFGGSALTILSTLKEIYKEKDFLHSAIDPFQKRDWNNSAITIVSQERFDNNFSFFEEKSSLILPKLIQKKEKFDLVYIDGSHLFEDVFVDFYYTFQLLEKNGIVIFDDCQDAHVKKVIKFIDSNYSEKLQKITNQVSAHLKIQKSYFKRIANFLGYRQVEIYKKVENSPRKWNVKFQRF